MGIVMMVIMIMMVMMVIMYFDDSDNVFCCIFLICGILCIFFILKKKPGVRKISERPVRAGTAAAASRRRIFLFRLFRTAQFCLSRRWLLDLVAHPRWFLILLILVGVLLQGGACLLLRPQTFLLLLSLGHRAALAPVRGWGGNALTEWWVIFAGQWNGVRSLVGFDQTGRAFCCLA